MPPNPNSTKNLEMLALKQLENLGVQRIKVKMLEKRLLNETIKGSQVLELCSEQLKRLESTFTENCLLKKEIMQEKELRSQVFADLKELKEEKKQHIHTIEQQNDRIEMQNETIVRQEKNAEKESKRMVKLTNEDKVHVQNLRQWKKTVEENQQELEHYQTQLQKLCQLTLTKMKEKDKSILGMKTACDEREVEILRLQAENISFKIELKEALQQK